MGILASTKSKCKFRVGGCGGGGCHCFNLDDDLHKSPHFVENLDENACLGGHLDQEGYVWTKIPILW